MQVTVVEMESFSRQVRTQIDRLDAPSVELRRPSHDPVDFVPFREEQFGQVGTILAGNAGNQCFSHAIKDNAEVCGYGVPTTAPAR